MHLAIEYLATKALDCVVIPAGMFIAAGYSFWLVQSDGQYERILMKIALFSFVMLAFAYETGYKRFSAQLGRRKYFIVVFLIPTCLSFLALASVLALQEGGAGL